MSISGEKYVPLYRDDHSNYYVIFLFQNVSAENTAHGLIEWKAAFTIPKSFISDGTTHFGNETVGFLPKALKVAHHFNLPYTQWGNETVKRLGRKSCVNFAR